MSPCHHFADVVKRGHVKKRDLYGHLNVRRPSTTRQSQPVPRQLNDNLPNMFDIESIIIQRISIFKLLGGQALTR